MTDDPHAIRENIAETRERLSSTIEEIGERLNPQTLTENVKDSIREATIGRMSTMARTAVDRVSRTSSGLAATIQENPMPAALIAVGIGWMIWSARSSSRRDADLHASDTDADGEAYDIGYGDEYGAAYSSGFGTASGATYGTAGYGTAGYGTAGYGSASYASGTAGMEDADDGTASRIGDAAARTTRRVRDRARSMAGSVSDRAADVAHRAREMSGEATQRARQMASSVAQTTRRQAERVEERYFDNPLAMGAVAMAVGLVAGLAVPVSDREVQLMGSTRDELVDRVKDVADETREKASRVVSRVVDDTKVAAREEGLTS